MALLGRVIHVGLLTTFPSGIPTASGFSTNPAARDGMNSASSAKTVRRRTILLPLRYTPVMTPPIIHLRIAETPYLQTGLLQILHGRPTVRVSLIPSVPANTFRES